MNHLRFIAPLSALLSWSSLAFAQDRPAISASDVIGGSGDMLKAVTDSQIKVLQKLIEITNDDDAEKPDLLFRMAELYAEQTRFYAYRAREIETRASEAEKKGDKEASAKFAEGFKEMEGKRKQWQLDAVKKFVELANGPKFQKFPKMDQVLFRLAHLLVEVGKEDLARPFFKRLVKDFPESPFQPHAHVSFGDYYFNQKDMENALVFYEKAASDDESPIYGYALYRKGWVKYTLKEYATAVETFSELLSYLRDDTRKPQASDYRLLRETRKDLVMAYSRSGSAALALDLFRRHGCDDATTMMKQLIESYTAQGKPELAQVVRRKLEEMKR